MFITQQTCELHISLTTSGLKHLPASFVAGYNSCQRKDVGHAWWLFQTISPARHAAAPPSRRGLTRHCVLLLVRGLSPLIVAAKAMFSHAPGTSALTDIQIPVSNLAASHNNLSNLEIAPAQRFVNIFFPHSATCMALWPKIFYKIPDFEAKMGQKGEQDIGGIRWSGCRGRKDWLLISDDWLLGWPH